MKYLLLIIFTITSTFSLIGQDFVQKKPQRGDGLRKFMSRYLLPYNECVIKEFDKLNQLNGKHSLSLDKSYKLPIRIYKYNTKSIRSTINITDWDQAVEIQEYNQDLVSYKLKSKVYTADNILWVPSHLQSCYIKDKQTNEVVTVGNNQLEYKIFGEKHKTVTIESQKLKGQVYYLISGHGGPDPGAVGKKNGKNLCEDEYGYDVTLRLAKRLISQGALVHLIIKDKNDGIRDDVYLKGDYDETCNGNKIPLSQKSRLYQRTAYINQLYKKYRKQGYLKQYAIFIHVDSRNENKEVDVFFYHHESSKTGKKVAYKLHKTIKQNYEKYQKGRGYTGTVTPRNLYVLSNATPPSIYIELGNIRNTNDHKRLLNFENREAIAKWLVEGILK